MRPPLRSTMSRVSHRPRPVPRLPLVVKNWVNRLGRISLRMPVPLLGYGEPGQVHFVTTNGRDPDVEIAAAGHGVDGIADEVYQGLANFSGGAERHGGRGLEVLHDTAFHDLAAEQRQGGPGQLGQIGKLRLGRGAMEPQRLLDDFADAAKLLGGQPAVRPGLVDPPNPSRPRQSY